MKRDGPGIGERCNDAVVFAIPPLITYAKPQQVVECLTENIKPLTLNRSMLLLYVTRRLYKPLNFY